MLNKNITIGTVPFSPEEAGYEALYLDRFNAFLIRLIEKDIIQGGSYHLIRHGKLFANNAIGSLDYRTPGKNLLPDSIMRIASITKDFTAVAIFQLAEQGYLDITDTVAEHIEEFRTPLHNKITIYNLLTHTSGLLPDWGAFETPYENDWVHHIDAFEGNWIKAMLTRPFHCPPNTEWVYSSSCFNILGEIIKRISGKEAEDYIMENIVNPLGMTDTYFEVPKEKFDCMIVNTEWSVPIEKKDKKEPDWLKDVKHKNFHLPKTGGGIYSTLADINTFNQMLHNGGKWNNVRIISRKSIENMTHPHLNGQNMYNHCWGANELHDCGLGFEVMNYKPFHQMTIGTYGHEGAGVSWSYVDPKEDFIASVFLPFKNGEFNMTPIHRSKYILWGGIV